MVVGNKEEMLGFVWPFGLTPRTDPLLASNKIKIKMIFMIHPEGHSDQNKIFPPLQNTFGDWE